MKPISGLRRLLLHGGARCSRRALPVRPFGRAGALARAGIGLLLATAALVAGAQAQTIGINTAGTVTAPTTITGTYSGFTANPSVSVTVSPSGGVGGVTIVSAGVGSGSYSANWSPTALGNYTITATATTTTPSQTATATSVVTVGSISPTFTSFTLVGGGNSVPVGSSRYLVAAATDDGAIDRIEFYLDGALVGTDTVAPYTLLFTAPNQLGSHQLTAKAYDNAGNSTTSSTLFVEVTTPIGSPPTVGILTPSSGAFLGANSGTTITGTASDSDGTIGTVQVFANGVSLGNATLTGSSWSINWTPTVVGYVSLSAIATDDKGNAIVAPAVGVNITDPTSPGITLSVSPGGTTLPTGATRNLVANVTPSAGRAVVRVEFFVDGAKVAEDTAAPFSYRYTAPASPGTAIVAARATDNAGLARDAQVTFTVTAAVGAPPNAALITPTNNTTVIPNTAISLAATATAVGGTISSVQFYQNGSPIGNALTAPPYTTSFNPTTPGSYVFDLIATDDRGNTKVSNASTVTAAFGTPTIAVVTPRADPTNPNASVRVTPNVPLTISATATAGSGANILLVEFLIDGAQIGTRTAAAGVTSGTFSFAWTPDLTMLGAHVLTVRVTDTNSVTATSNPINLNVANVVGTPPTLTITTPGNNAVVQSLSTINLIANAFATGGTISSVEFFLNDASIGLAAREQATNVYRLPFDLSRVDYSALTPNANGQYPLTLYAIAKDSNGNQTVFPAVTPLNLLVNPSQSLPPSVQLLTGTNSVTAGTLFAIGVIPNDPDGTVTNVQLFSNGSTQAIAAVGNPPLNTLSVLQFTPQTAGRFNLYAVVTDDTGNTSVSAPVILNVTGNTAPSAVLVRPSDDSTVTTVNTPVFLEATSSDPDVGQGVTVSFINTVTGQTLATGTRLSLTSDTYRAVWTPTQANTFTVAARAQDTAGGQTTSSASRRVVVNNVIGIAPVITITTPNSVTTASSVNLSATASDSDGSVIGVEFFVNRNSIGQAVRDQLTNTWRITASFTGIAPGSAEVVALARDNSGNVAVSTTNNVNVTAASGIAPSISITPSTTNVAFSRQVQLTANARDTDGSVASVQYFANGSSIGTTFNSGTNFLLNWTPNQSGTFNLYAVATDSNGNTTVSPTVQVTVRRNNPVLDDSAFILQSYTDIANSTPNTFILSDLDSQLAAGTLTRAQLVTNLTGETGFVAPVNLLASYYIIMGQWPTPANYATLLNIARGSLSNAIGSILTSQEYIAKYPEHTTPTVTLLNTLTSVIPAATLEARLWANAGLGAPSALEDKQFRDNTVATTTTNPPAGRGYNAAGLNTAIAEFVTVRNVNNTALFNRAKAAALYYQLDKPLTPADQTPAQITDAIAARVNALAAMADTTAMAEAVLNDVLYTYRYVTILRHPASLTVAPRSGAIFSVDAIGQPPLAYQWLLNGAPIPGATTATLNLTNVDTSRVGTYTVAITSSQNSATSDPATLTLSTAPTRLVNISTRGATANGANILIGGFVVTGAPNQTRQMLIRVVGPGISGAPFNVQGTLADPRLAVYGANPLTPLLTNDNWGNQTGGAAAVQAIQQATNRAGAFALAANSNDAVVLATLPPGNYTVQASGPPGSSTGVVLLEVYDVTPGATGPKSANVSTRADVGTGASTLIAGFVINGTVSRRMLIRGVGPTLRNFGIGQNALLADPQITLADFATGKTIKTNDDWASGDDAAVIASAASAAGAFPLANGSKDAAMIVMLAPGAYTVQLSGVNNTTGIGIVEVYDVDP